MNPEIAQLQKEVAELKMRLDLLTNSSTIPFDIDNAFKERIGLKDSPIAVFTKSVAEGGGASYTVAKTPDGNYITHDNRLVPYYNLP